MTTRVCYICKEKKPSEEFEVNLTPPDDDNEIVVYSPDCKACRAAWLLQCKRRFEEDLYGSINFW